MYELTNRQVRFSYLFDQKGQSLRCLEANDPLQTIDHPVLLRFPCNYLPDKSVYRGDPIYHAVNHIIARKGLISVRDLARQCYMNERPLRRQFLLKVGLSPQAYAKIWQLLDAMELLRYKRRRSLSDVAFDAGYYDVAHLARDFRNKLSVPPSKFYHDINALLQSYLDFPDFLK